MIMDYLSMIARQSQERPALLCDERSYTYGELAQAAGQERRQALTAGGGRRAVFIHEEKIAAQLIRFLAYSGTELVPVIATEASRGQEFASEAIPPAAVMGVLTSGSTGSSKLLWRDFASWADFFPEQNRVFGIDSGSVVFCQGSLAFTGNLNIYLGVLAAGGSLVATERFRPRYWQRRITECGVNCLYLIPSKLLLLPKVFAAAEPRVRSIVSGSQSMGREEADRLLKIFPGAELTLYYGASELNYITYIKDREMTADRTLIGRPFKDVGISIRGEEIFIDTPYHVEGVSLPFSLKDRGRLDAEGRLHFLGRTDDICNINGRKVSAVKVEQALTALADIEEAAVLGLHVQDADVLAACVGTGRRWSKPELLALLRAVLEEHELPKQFLFLPELPKNESGKLDKRRLREMLTAGREK